MAPPRKCLYETLCISRTATDEEIKKAYRKQALVHHPDKNPGVEAAEENFKQIQHAFSVLSDAHERAWYDGHRAEILRGVDPSAHAYNDGNEKSANAASATELDLFSYFSPAAYSGFEGARSFYSVFAHVFDQLLVEECDADENVETTATFGGANADWATVRNFYGKWESFSSRKTFAFADKWNLADAPSRDHRRIMERDNKRDRNRVRKEFNSMVRELATFVKKRDPRVARRREEEERERQAESERVREREELRKKERKIEMEQMRAMRDEVLEEDGEELDSILANIAKDERIERRQKREARRRQRDGSQPPDGDGDDANELEVDKDDVDMVQGEHSDIEDADEFSSDDSDEVEAVEELYCAACKKPFRNMAQKADHERSKKHKIAMAKLKREVLEEEARFKDFTGQQDPADEKDEVENGDLNMDNDNGPDGTFMKFGGTKKRRKQKAARKQATGQLTGDSNEGEGNVDETDGGDKHGDDKHVGDKQDGDEVMESALENEPKERAMTKKEKRRLRERRKKESEQSGTAGVAASKGASPTELRCATCGTKFASRTKLMRHVRDANHALHVEVGRKR